MILEQGGWGDVMYQRMNKKIYQICKYDLYKIQICNGGFNNGPKLEQSKVKVVIRGIKEGNNRGEENEGEKMLSLKAHGEH